jgi:hypothetical protein
MRATVAVGVLQADRAPISSLDLYNLKILSIDMGAQIRTAVLTEKECDSTKAYLFDLHA